MSGPRAPQPGALLLRQRFPARAAELRAVREAVRREALAQGCAPECAGDVVIAVDEVCQNIIRHAYAGCSDGEIVLELERDGEELVVSLRDFAPPVDPSRVRPRDLDDVRPGGLGTHLIREVMDGAGFAPAPPGGGNLFRMRKRIRKQSAKPGAAERSSSGKQGAQRGEAERSSSGKQSAQRGAAERSSSGKQGAQRGEAERSSSDEGTG